MLMSRMLDCYYLVQIFQCHLFSEPWLWSQVPGGNLTYSQTTGHSSNHTAKPSPVTNRSYLIIEQSMNLFKHTSQIIICGWTSIISFPIMDGGGKFSKCDLESYFDKLSSNCRLWELYCHAEYPARVSLPPLLWGADEILHLQEKTAGVYRRSHVHSSTRSRQDVSVQRK